MKNNHSTTLSNPLKLLKIPKLGLSLLNYEDWFRLLYICQTVVCVFLFKEMFNFREMAHQHNIDVISFTDFKYVALGLVVIHCSKMLIRSLCYDYVSKNLNQRYTGQFKLMRVEKIIKWIYDGLYYSISSVLFNVIQFTVWYFFHEESWYPNSLGGKDFKGMMEDYPRLVYNKWLMPFYMFQTASHLYALLHLIYKGTKFELKYWEYMLHHSLAFYLLFFSATYNLVRYGVVVLAIHDLADIVLSSGRAYNDLTNSKFLIYLQYGLLKISWVYTRLYIFPQVIYHAFCDYRMQPEYWPSSRWAILYLSVQMTTLLIMHIYWTYFMAQIGLSVIKGKNYRENYDNREIKVNENVQGE